MLFLLLMLAVLLVPGYLLATLVGIREYRFLFSVTLSYFCFIVLGAVAAEFSLAAPGLAAIYAMTFLPLLVLVVVLVRKGIITSRDFTSSMFSETLDIRTVLIIVVAIGLYHLLVGYYDEVPSDLLQHLRYSIREAGFIADQFRLDFGDVLVLRKSGNYWYYLVAWLSTISDTPHLDLFPYVLVTCATFFLVAVALCADRLFRPLGYSHLQHQAAIVLAVFFVFTQMGINVISFVRYYSYAPTMLNFVIYFCALVCILNIFEKKDSVVRSLAIIVIAVWVSYLVHEQEALFIILAFSLLLVWRCLDLWWRRRNSGVRNYAWPLVVLVGLVGGAIAAYAAVRLNYGFRTFSHSKIIPLPLSLPYFGQLHVLDPAYQFIRVVTVWGIAVYVLFLLHWKQFSRQPFLVVAMISPLLTVFNPLFVDTFIRLGHTTTLWRMCYFIPLHFVAAALCVFLWNRLKASSLPHQALSSAALVLLFVLLLPSLASVPINSYAKTTLEKTPEANRLAYWRDLIEQLAGMENEYTVLTDPVTGYMISAFTRHKTYQYKFLPGRIYYFRPFLFDSYDEFPLARYSGKLLVVNNRNGGPSKTGELSNHWHRDILRLTDYYSAALTDHLESNPDKFENMWSQDRVSIYLIR